MTAAMPAIRMPMIAAPTLIPARAPFERSLGGSEAVEVGEMVVLVVFGDVWPGSVPAGEEAEFGVDDVGFGRLGILVLLVLLEFEGSRVVVVRVVDLEVVVDVEGGLGIATPELAKCSQFRIDLIHTSRR